MIKCQIDSIEPKGSDGMFEALLSTYRHGEIAHGECVAVIGSNFTETVMRAAMLVTAISACKDF